MSFQGIEPPRDAEGREIPLNTKVLYHPDGERVQVASFNYWPQTDELRVVVFGFFGEYKTSDFFLSPPDSWKKLEDDIYSAVMSEYLEDPRADVRTLVSRAKALAEREKA